MRTKSIRANLPKGRTSPRKRIKASKIVIDIILVLSTCLILLPIVTMLMTSLKTFEDVQQNPAGLIPTQWTLQNYVTVFVEFPFLQYLLNTLILTISSTIGTTLTSAMVAYAFSRFNVKFKGALFTIMLGTIMIPGQILQIPLYELYRALHWINTYAPFIVPAFLGGGITNVFLIRQFFNSLPKSLFESAQIDGASEFRIFIQIAIPLSRAIIITVAIFAFTSAWNDFYSPLLYLNEESKYNLAYGLYIFFDKFKVGSYKAWNIICAANLVVILPIIVLYFFAQKFFVEGITLGGVKG